MRKEVHGIRFGGFGGFNVYWLNLTPIENWDVRGGRETHVLSNVTWNTPNNLDVCVLRRVSTRSGGAAGTSSPRAVVFAPGACGGPHLRGRLRRGRKRELHIYLRLVCPCVESLSPDALCVSGLE